MKLRHFFFFFKSLGKIYTLNHQLFLQGKIYSETSSIKFPPQMECLYHFCLLVLKLRQSYDLSASTKVGYCPMVIVTLIMPIVSCE